VASAGVAARVVAETVNASPGPSWALSTPSPSHAGSRASGWSAP